LASAPAQKTTWLSGAWVGVDTLSDYTAFGAWRGRPLGLATTYQIRDSWSAIQSNAYAEQQMVGFKGVLDIGVPLLPDNSDGATLADVASGKEDAAFTGMADAIKADGQGNSYLRIGWEPNEVDSPWSITGAAGMKTADYVAAFQHVATLMRTIMPGVKIVYCGDYGIDGNMAITGDPLGSLYPGDAYVDVIGVDVYSSKAHPGSTAAEFAALENGSHGLTAWANFAKAHGKPLAVPEWGFFSADSGVHDAPTFIASMHQWFAAQGSNLAYESYFSDPSVGDVLTGGANPLSAAAYKSLWSN
jgi:Glycosyl hydrolase family 26